MYGCCWDHFLSTYKFGMPTSSGFFAASMLVTTPLRCLKSLIQERCRLMNDVHVM